MFDTTIARNRLSIYVKSKNTNNKWREFTCTKDLVQACCDSHEIKVIGLSRAQIIEVKLTLEQYIALIDSIKELKSTPCTIYIDGKLTSANALTYLIKLKRGNYERTNCKN